ncbi:hypothetical protein BDV26DRAFT_257787 [Aspergillus bertholletiae]|uniref:Plastocyanin-like domain-containing protein n=1 Tax=Aspergillus bertholletiae TaxID=1226010 RepID=A0A5N7BEV9_9EURO|nr:hypothetical protein BDV26DRAFT_257787 [Aspergillus bertholletiae]
MSPRLFLVAEILFLPFLLAASQPHGRPPAKAQSPPLPDSRVWRVWSFASTQPRDLTIGRVTVGPILWEMRPRTICARGTRVTVTVDNEAERGIW